MKLATLPIFVSENLITDASIPRRTAKYNIKFPSRPLHTGAMYVEVQKMLL